MKAAVLKNWLDLELCDIPVPVPGENEALIKEYLHEILIIIVLFIIILSAIYIKIKKPFSS